MWAGADSSLRVAWKLALKVSRSRPLNKKLIPTRVPSTQSRLRDFIVRIIRPRTRVTRPLVSPQPQPLIWRWLRATTVATAPSSRNTTPMARAREATWEATRSGPEASCRTIHRPATRKRVATVKRQKLMALLRRGLRARVLTQPTIPPTRNPIATMAVTHTEANTGKTRARRPSTSISTPSAKVKVRRALLSRARRPSGGAAATRSLSSGAME